MKVNNAGSLLIVIDAGLTPYLAPFFGGLCTLASPVSGLTLAGLYRLASLFAGLGIL